MASNLINILFPTASSADHLNLREVEATDCDFSNLNLSEGNLHSAKIQKSSFIDTDLSASGFKYASFSECDFTNTNFSGADDERAKFINSVFIGNLTTPKRAKYTWSNVLDLCVRIDII